MRSNITGLAAGRVIRRGVGIIIGSPSAVPRRPMSPGKERVPRSRKSVKDTGGPKQPRKGSGPAENSLPPASSEALVGMEEEAAEEEEEEVQPTLKKEAKAITIREGVDVWYS
eukprot:1178327-Prorocentrum_minimum.AAC.2